ncbi:hypothetical protein MTO96_049022 [Rhipicephalus appendiculatus]
MEVRIISSVLVIALLDRYLVCKCRCLDLFGRTEPQKRTWPRIQPLRSLHTMEGPRVLHRPDHARRASQGHHFRKDLCFYECEPNIGPWIVTVERKIGKERFFEVPLCYSDCVAWWEDCKYDYACTPNWPRGFKFYGGKNHCPKGAKCVTFEEMYKGPTDFCSQVWDHSWKVVPDHVPCMHMWFNTTSGGNPNRAVAEFYYQRGKRGQGSAELPNAADHVASSMAAQLVLLLATSTAAMLAWIDVFHHC